MAGKRLVFLAGNHDHHIAVRQLATYVELEVATADEEELEAELAGHRGYFKRYPRSAALPDIDSEIVYPTYRFGDAPLLPRPLPSTPHMTGSLADRLLNRGTWGHRRRPPDEADDLRLRGDDRAAHGAPLQPSPQLPNGTAAQQSALEHLQRLAHLAGFVRAPARELQPPPQDAPRTAAAFRAEPNPSRAVDPTDHPSGALSAYGKVVRNLGWDHETKTMVFAPHPPAASARARPDDAGDGPRCSGTRAPGSTSRPAATRPGSATRERAWPGSAGPPRHRPPRRPELLRLLESYAVQGPGWEPSA